MWVFFTRRLRRWLLPAVAGPILGWTLSRAVRQLEQRHGQTRISRGLHTAARQLTKRRDSNNTHR